METRFPAPVAQEDIMEFGRNLSIMENSELRGTYAF